MNLLGRTRKFHGHADLDLPYWLQQYRPHDWLIGRETKYFVIQERDVSYRVHQHAHPFVGSLMQKLIGQGVSGLQRADTDYARDGASLPGSVLVSTPAETTVTLVARTRVSLVSKVQASLSGSGSLPLGEATELRTAADVRAVLASGVRARLLEGMTPTPAEGASFLLGGEENALLERDSRVTLFESTPVVLASGTAATLPAGTSVVLRAGTRVVAPAATRLTLLKSARRPVLYAPVLSATSYRPTALVRHPYPVDDLDFSSGGAYSVYNWELFFHVPLTIAIHLSKNQRYADAQRWFHYVFDPTDGSDGPTPERFWKARPFHTTEAVKLETMLVNLATGADEDLRRETVRSIEAWKDAPFRPHVIARYRQQAYMYKTVMSYLDNLIAWGDSLFRQDTGESIDEAQVIYVLAASILGPRPQAVPAKGSIRPQTYATLRKDLKQFGTALRDIEADIPFDLFPLPGDAEETQQVATLRSLGRALYFGVPRNDKLLSYWDTVADRLFKIRNSLNVHGVFRQLALFEPPIDPALLARAVAAGVDVGAVVSGLNQPLPLVRFPFLAQKATELAQEVKTLGGSLLQAMQREDDEALAVLRARHERIVMETVEQVKYMQLQEAIKSSEGLVRSMAGAVQRYAYYERLLGRERDEIEKAIPQLDALDTASLDKMRFAMTEAELALRDIEVDIAEDLGAAGGRMVSSHEAAEMRKLDAAHATQELAAVLDTLAGAMAVIPTFGGHMQPLGPGASISFGGAHIAASMSSMANVVKTVGARQAYEAARTARIGGYARREQDWAFQSVLAATEINQTLKQLRAAQLREAIAAQELKSHRQQIHHAKDIEVFLNEQGSAPNGKRANRALFGWMRREIKGLYAQSFQLAFDTARKAERALQHELGTPGLTYLQPGYLAGKEGLLAGEKLYLDVTRMTMAYHELNRREYELTKHVSLMQLDPLQLVALRVTGRCTVALPEALFDMDGPGHYFRRIKSVAITLPSVVGPYTSVNCTLTLVKSGIRTSPVLRDGSYVRENAEDDRFVDYLGSQQSIVTSSGQNDAGVFDVRDERYLPFENAGVVSEWLLQLPADPSKGQPSQFDYDTIADVILHVRYTAREGGELLRRGAQSALVELVKAGRALGSPRLLSVRHEFPAAWAAFKAQVLGPDQRFGLTLELKQEHYPFWSRASLTTVKAMSVFARSSKERPPSEMDVFRDANKASAGKSTLRTGKFGDLLFVRVADGSGLALPTRPVGPIALFFDDPDLHDLWIAVEWASEAQE